MQLQARGLLPARLTPHENMPTPLQVSGGVGIPITRRRNFLPGHATNPSPTGTTIGDKVIGSGGIQKKLVEMSHGLPATSRTEC